MHGDVIRPLVHTARNPRHQSQLDGCIIFTNYNLKSCQLQTLFVIIIQRAYTLLQFIFHTQKSAKVQVRTWSLTFSKQYCN